MPPVPIDRNTLPLFDALSDIHIRYPSASDAFEEIAVLCKTHLDSQVCLISLVDLNKRYVQVVPCRSDFDSHFRSALISRRFTLGSIEQGDSLDFQLAARGEIIERYGLQDQINGIINPLTAQKYGLHAVLCYPIKTPNRVYGYINHFSSSNQPFTETEKNILKVYANAAALIKRNFDNQERLRSLNNIIQEMIEVTDEQTLIDLLLEKSLELTNCTTGDIDWLDPASGKLVIKALQGKAINQQALVIGKGITGKALENENPIRVDDVTEAEWAAIYTPFVAGTRSELAVPILLCNSLVRVGEEVKIGSKPFGVLNLESPVKGAFSEEDENILWALAKQAAIIFDKIEYDRKLSKLNNYQKQILGKLQVDDVFFIVMEGITETLGYEYVNVSLVSKELNQIKTTYLKGIPERDVKTFKKMAAHSLDSLDIQAEIVRHKKIVVPPQHDKRFDQNIFKRFGHQDIIRIFIPMLTPSDNNVIGTIEAGYNRNFRNHIYERDVQVLNDFINYAMVALEQKRRVLLDRASHELTAPAVGIKNNANFLQRRIHQLDDEYIQRKLSDIVMDCEILILEIEEIEHILGRPSPKQKIQRTLVYRDIIIKTINQLKPLITEKKFDYSKIHYDPQDVPKINIFVDPAILGKVVYNLLINSIKYSKPDPDQFAIFINVEENRDYFIIRFRDWGIGIEKEYTDKIFEEGFRTPQAIQKNVSGSGLGLMISRKIMRELGGDLILVNNYAPTEFQMILPKTLKEYPK